MIWHIFVEPCYIGSLANFLKTTNFIKKIKSDFVECVLSFTRPILFQQTCYKIAHNSLLSQINTFSKTIPDFTLPKIRTSLNHPNQNQILRYMHANKYLKQWQNRKNSNKKKNRRRCLHVQVMKKWPFFAWSINRLAAAL